MKKLFSLCWRTAMKLQPDESIKVSNPLHHTLSQLIWSIQQCCHNKTMMTYFGTRKTDLILSQSLDTIRTLFRVPTDVSLLRRELGSWADSFERFRSGFRSLGSACVKDTGWSSSSRLYASYPTTIVMLLCSESDLYSMLPFSSETGRSGPWGIGTMAVGTSRYCTWCLFLQFIQFTNPSARVGYDTRSIFSSGV